MSINEDVANYWLKYYVDKKSTLCALCANTGIIDTTGIKSPAGTEPGGENYCICPNGQTMREYGVDFNTGMATKEVEP